MGWFTAKLIGATAGFTRRYRTGSRLRAQETDAKAAGVVTELEACEVVPFHLQGDREMYSCENLRERERLRTNPEVVEAMHLWWVTALNSIHSAGSDAHALSREQYTLMMRKMYKLLIEEHDEVEVLASAEQDWERDSHGAATLTREGFMDAMYEFADLWTLSVEADDYVDFLRVMHGKLAYGTPPDQFFWKDDADIHYDPSYLDADDAETDSDDEDEEKK